MYEPSPPPENDRAEAPLVILIPVYNDTAALGELLLRLDDVLHAKDLKAHVLVVDDGSTVAVADEAVATDYRALERLDVLELRRNLGHQRAIAIGLAYLEDQTACHAVVVMDCDGEDAPEDVPRLLERYRAEHERKIVFAERTRRSESLAFRLCYAVYKLMHYLLTGHRVRVGNFSVIPRSRLASLVVVSEMWNHYAAAVFKSRQPHCSIPTTRGRRLQGESSMDFVGLVVHGLSAISVYGEVVGVRFLVLALLLILLSLVGVVCILVVKLTTSLAVPGWATYTLGLLMIILFQAVMLAAIFSFVILGGRTGSFFLPRRDYAYFLGRMHRIYPRP